MSNEAKAPLPFQAEGEQMSGKTPDWEDNRETLLADEVLRLRAKNAELEKSLAAMWEMPKIRRVWAMPNKATFTIKPIAELLHRYVRGGLWADPFAGWNSPATLTNDLDPESPAKTHIEALEFAKNLEYYSLDGVLFDPPYSPRQVAEVYKSIGKTTTMKTTQANFWTEVKDALTLRVKIGGVAICCGWTSQGFGKNRGFELEEILLVPHGGHHNDTIVTVEQRIPAALASLDGKGGEKE